MEAGFVKGQSDNLPKIDSIMIVEFFSNNPHFTSVEMRGVKAASSGRENYGDAAIGYVQLKRASNVCTVKTKICPEHKVRAKNYSVIVEVNEADEKIRRAECQDCAASAGGCKHTVAVVMWLHRRSEEPSPTETVCYWKKSRLSSVGTSLKFLTTSDFGTPKSPTPAPFIRGSFLGEFVERGKSAGSLSQVLNYYPEPDDLSALGLHQLLCDFVSQNPGIVDCDSFLEFARNRITPEACGEACKKTIDQSECKLWYDLRYGRVTASKLYEAARCKTLTGTFVESVIGALKVKETAPMKRGKLLEKRVLRVLSKQLNISIQSTGLLLTRDHVVLGASPDSISENYVIEVKCPSSSKTVDNYYQGNAIKNKFKAQMQLQINVHLKKKEGHILCCRSPV